MDRKLYYLKIFSVALVMLFIFLPTISSAQTTVEDIDIKVKIDGNTILNGEKGVNHSINQINIIWENTDYILNDERSLSEITISAKNSENEDKEESYKFNFIASSDNNIDLNIKEYLDSEEEQKKYELQKHTLYSIHIPKGLIISKYGKKINKDIYIDFVTEGDSGNDILVSASPVHKEERVDISSNSIVFEFVDDVDLNYLLKTNEDIYKSNYISIASETLNSNLYYYKSDSIENFDLSVEGNKLILKKKNGGKLKDFSKYTVKLKDKGVYLKDTSSGIEIYNKSEVINSQWTSIEFKTNKTVYSTSPENYEKNVGLEPTIKIKFRHYPKPINSTSILNNMNLWIGEVDGEEIALDSSNTEIYVADDKRTLVIELKDSQTNVKGLLRANTSYTITIDEGIIEFNLTDKEKNTNLKNEKIVLNFTTGNSGESPKAIAFSSNSSLTDDITDLGSTGLDSSGSIYIAFDKVIKFDKDFELDLKKEEYDNIETINNYFKLYEATTTLAEYAYSQEYNSDIHIYNKYYIDTDGDDMSEEYILPEGINIQYIDKPEDITKFKSFPIKNVEILEYNNVDIILKITPKYSLENLSKYKLSINKGIIENLSGYNLDKNVEFSFWTKKSNQNIDVSWESVEGYDVDGFKEDMLYFELPKYGENLPADDDSNIVEKLGKTPISIDVKGEIIPKAKEDLLESLKDILLRDYYGCKDEDGSIIYDVATIQKIATQYYLKDGEPHTKLYIYPTELDFGRSYKLKIPSGTFQSRSGKNLPKLEFNFVVKSNSSKDPSIICLQNNENAIETISKEEWEILIRGYNFTQDIDKVVIEDLGSGKTVQIISDNIEFEDVTTIKVKIRDDSKSDFLNEFGSIDDETKLSITIYFNDGTFLDADGLTITPKDGPDSSEKDPSDMDIWYDENEINKKKIDGEYIYFLKVTFDDTDIDGDGDGDIDIKHTKSSDGTKNYTGLETLREWSSIKASGSSVSFLNSDFIRKVIDVLEDEEASESKKNRYLEYIFEKNEDKEEAYLYVPIKLLNSQTTYNVNIASDVIVYSGSSEGNETIRWSFTTMANPVATDVFIGSVVEDYDEDKPIIITGQYYYDDVEVYFNDIEAEDVDIEESEDGDIYLEVYLPDGRDRLEPGIYDIYIENDKNHVRELYGAFSVVKEGEWIPNEEYISDESDFGEVRADIMVSENTIMLESKYNDDRYLELDLDELMTPEALVRKITIDGDKSDKIGILKTKSKWANIDLYNVGLDSNSDDDEITLILGRADQALKQALQKKLAGSSIKSEFIRVTGKNCVVDSIILGIPFEKSNGKNLKVLRYDEDTRNFYMEKMSVNQVDKIVTVQSKAAGIFVVIEN